ncbi:hypothetical protein S83_023545, partial [Arachis hypogaea]
EEASSTVSCQGHRSIRVRLTQSSRTSSGQRMSLSSSFQRARFSSLSSASPF